MISLIVKLLKFFSVLIFAVIFLELTVRFLYPQNITPTHITVKYDIPNSLKSNFKQEGVNSLGVRYRVVTNEKSLRRDAPIKYKKDDNIYRILVLGDSIAYGRGVGNRETFSFYLENLLKKAKPGINFEVLNSAVPYWGPLQYYFYMKNEGYKYNSDLIILALESSNAEELNMHQIQFKKSYHKKTKTYCKKVQDSTNISNSPTFRKNGKKI